MGTGRKSAAIDAHCHLELFDDPASAVSLSMKNGISAIITSGWSIESSRRAAELTKIGGVFATIGLGPEDSVIDFSFIDEFDGIAKANKKVVGIGEIGLDVKAAEKINLEKQEELFGMQLGLAIKLGIPAVIHCRGLLNRAMQIVEESGIEKAMFHFFSGNEEDAKRLEKGGYLISIPPTESSRLRRVIRSVDTGSLAAETDAPLVGKTPSDAVLVVEKVADLKGISFEEAGLRMMQTIKDYFGIIIREGP